MHIVTSKLGMVVRCKKLQEVTENLFVSLSGHLCPPNCVNNGISNGDFLFFIFYITTKFILLEASVF